MTRILVIEDDPDIALSLKYNLEREPGFEVVVAGDGESGLESVRERKPDLVLLDLNLPGFDGYEVCRRLRSDPATSDVPVIMVTARVEETDKISGLDRGADDYVTKPFSTKELMARVRAVLRRAGGGEVPERLEVGDLQVDRGERTVRAGGTEVRLTRKEFDLLVDLITSRGRVLDRERLLERVWGYDHPGDTRTVDVHVRQLRKKLGPPFDGWIETVVGVGYRFRAPR